MIDLSKCVCWLRFNDSPIDDFIKKNNWTAYGTPTISSENAINGNALQLDNSRSFLELKEIELGGQDFTVDFWFRPLASLLDRAESSSNLFTLFSSCRSEPYDDTFIQFNIFSWNNDGTEYLEFAINDNANSNRNIANNGWTTGNSSGSLMNQNNHFRWVYHYSQKLMEFYLNGRRVRLYDYYVPQYNRQKFDIYIGGTRDSKSGTANTPFPVSIDEFMILDGIALNDVNTNFTPPTADYYDSLTLFSQEISFDTERIVQNNRFVSQTISFDTERNVQTKTALSLDTKRVVRNKQTRWIYKNYGTADLLTVAGTTVTNLPASQSKTGSAFYQPTRAKCFDIPSTNEIWIKCDINVVANVTSSRIRIYHEDSNGKVCGLSTYGGNIASNYFYWINNTKYDGGYRIARNDEGYSKQPFLLHMKSGVTDGFLEFYFWRKSNQTYRSFTGNVNNGADFDNVYIQMDGSNIYVSNLIISNEPLEITDDVYYYVNFQADTLRSLSGGVYFFLCDTLRNVVKPADVQADTQRYVIRIENFNADTCRKVNSVVQDVFDTYRNVISVENFLVDTVRKLPHTFKIFPLDTADNPLLMKNSSLKNLTPNIAIDTSDVTPGLQSFSIAIAAQQLTDNISFSGVIPVAILEQIQGKYLDYDFNVRIERLKQQGIIYSADCCTDIDEILYTKIRYKIPNEDCYTRIYDNDSEDWKKNFSPGVITKEEIKGKAIGGKISSANVHAQTIAAVLGKQPALLFDDFLSTADAEPSGGTYQDAISNIFGWTSRIPHKLINVYIRANNLFVVQRGFEPNVIDLSDTKHTLPIYSYELVRTSFGGEAYDKTITTETRGYSLDRLGSLVEPDDDDDGDYKKEKKTPDGLVESTTVKEGYLTTETYYEYDKDGQVVRCTVKVTSSEKFPPEVVSETVTVYYYKITKGGRKVLVEEAVTEYDGRGHVVDERVTVHTYLEQGQTHTASFSEDGSYLGGSVGANRGNDRRSSLRPPEEKIYIYDANGKKRVIGTFNSQTSYGIQHETQETSSSTLESRTIHGISMVDSSFPVHGYEKLAEITADINWLNRKVKETVSMTIYDYPHFIDFTDRIIFNGNTYYLETNKADTNYRIINQQTVSFVRWYGA